MSYTPTNWANGKAPALNADNLNKIENELVKLDNDVSSLAEVVAKPDITTTDQTTMPNSYDGRLLVKEIGGKCVQGENPSPTYPQEIKKTVVSEIRTHGVQMLPSKITLNNTGLSAIIDEQNRIVLSGTTKDTTSADLYVYGEWGGNNDLGIRGQVSIGTNLGDAYLLHKNTIVGLSLAGSAINRNITDDNYITAIMVRFPANTTCNGVLELMLNEGTEALPYEPYTESVVTLSQPIELYDKNGVQDVIEGKQIKRKVKALKVTDFKTIAVSEDTNWYDANKSYSYELKACKYPIVDASLKLDLCTHFKTYNFYDFYNKGIENGVLSGQAYMVVNISKSLGICKTIDEFRQWCIDNDVTFYKELKTETTEEMPLADQIALNSLSTYDGITYLEFDSEIEPTFKGEYGTSKVGGYTLEGMLAGRNGELYGKDYNSRLSALETSVVNNI